MPTLAYILLFTFLASIGSLAGGFLLLAKKEFAMKISHFLTSFAAGVLLASAFLDLLPEAFHESRAIGWDIFTWTLAGLLIFFLTEQLLHWFHHHDEHFHAHDQETATAIPLIVAGDTMHNFVDGVIIAATFLVNAPLGMVTALAVAAHEIPQEIGDAAFLLHKGLSRKKIVVINLMSACAAFAGAIGAYLFGSVVERYVAVFLALTAGFFIYIAASDIIPEIHYEKSRGSALAKSGLLLLGVIVFAASLSLIGHGE